MAGSASSEEDMEMDAYDDDIKVVPEARKTYEVDYKPLTHQDVKDLMEADIDYIRTIFGVDVSLYSTRIFFSFQYSAYRIESRSCSPSPTYGLEQRPTHREIHGQCFVNFYGSRRISHAQTVACCP
jgi:hypothetical protein